MAVFLCIGGHRMVMAGLLDTFHAIPPGGAGLPDSVQQTCEVLLAESFSLGVQAAAPVVTALLLATLVVGLVGRTLPQLNLMALGFSLYALVMFGVLIISLGGIIWVFQDQVEPILNMMLETLRAAPKPL
jgi:flagellar biosynthetic protein FliR